MKKLMLLALGFGVMSSISAAIEVYEKNVTVKPDKGFVSTAFTIKNEGMHRITADVEKATFSLKGPGLLKTGLTGAGQTINLPKGDYTVLDPSTPLNRDFTVTIKSI